MSGDNTNSARCSVAADALNDTRLLRYSRHLLLDEIGIDGQTRLLNATALIIGAGGLGSPVALYLAAAGVGQILIADDDTVDLTNLQRQIAHTQASLGINKAESAAAHLRAVNPGIVVEAMPQRLSGAALAAAVARADVVLDCSDNFATRYAINRACVALRRPLVSGAALRFDGQISVFPNAGPDAPCYACLF
ncbi:MAG: HesA/MoeB/ThiF family protein, partial [Betaproteobacteria bacterium]